MADEEMRLIATLEDRVSAQLRQVFERIRSEQKLETAACEARAAHRPGLLAKKSRSTVSWPILA